MGEQQNGNDRFVDLLTALDTLAEAIKSSREADNNASKPSECQTMSVQGLAYVFGQLVGIYALEDKDWRDNLFCESECIIEGKQTRINPWEEMWSNTGREVPLLVGSLLSEYELGRDWASLREHYLQMWDGSYATVGGLSLSETGLLLSQIGPEMDIYWAMRVGLADKVLQATSNEKTASQTDNSLKQHVETILDVSEGIALRQVRRDVRDEERWNKQEGQLNKLLEHTQAPQEIRSRVIDRFHGVSLPQEVVNRIVRAESLSTTSPPDALVRFGEAVEACLSIRFVQPLCKYAEAHGGEIPIYSLRAQGVEQANPSRLGELTLGDWAENFKMLDRTMGAGLPGLGVRELRTFLEQHLNVQRLPNFSLLSQLLRDVQRCAIAGKHFKPDYDIEDSCHEMRLIIWGFGNRPSIIRLIVTLFAPKNN